MSVQSLSSVSIFRGCSDECLKDAATRLEHIYFGPESPIIKRGDAGNEMYLIGHGSVSIHIAEHHLATLESGSCFGEMALIEDAVRTADVTAAGYCDLYKLSKDHFAELCNAHQDLVVNVQKMIVQRQQVKENPPNAKKAS